MSKISKIVIGITTVSTFSCSLGAGWEDINHWFVAVGLAGLACVFSLVGALWFEATFKDLLEHREHE